MLWRYYISLLGLSQGFMTGRYAAISSLRNTIPRYIFWQRTTASVLEVLTELLHTQLQAIPVHANRTTSSANEDEADDVVQRKAEK